MPAFNFFKNHQKKQLLAALVCGLAARLYMAWTYYGFKYMDEHWQVIEPANSLVHGVWSKTVEWEEGLRSWVFPYLVSLFIKAFEALGVTEPLWIIASLRSVMAFISMFAIYYALKLFWHFGRTANLEDSALFQKLIVAAAWFLCLLPYSIYSGTHLNGEMPGAVLFLFGFYHLFLKRYYLTGLFFGMALCLKIDLAVGGLFCGIWFLIHLRIKDSVKLLLGALPFIILVGFIDKLTWGSWFHNVLGHARVNLVEEIGNQWGVSPWYEHFIFFLSMVSVPGVISLALLPKVWGTLDRAIKGIWFTHLGFIAVFSYIQHKEKRFMVPLLYSGVALTFFTAYLALTLLKKERKFPYKSDTYLKPLAVLASLFFLAHLGTEVKNYLIARPWHERVLALRQAAQIPDSQKFISLQWPAIFYFPRHIPAVNSPGDRASIEKETQGLDVVAVVHDGKHMTWWEEAGFQCQPWPTPPRISKDPVPAAYRCQRSRSKHL